MMRLSLLLEAKLKQPCMSDIKAALDSSAPNLDAICKVRLLALRESHPVKCQGTVHAIANLYC